MDRLECVVQNYAWGDPTWIPELLGVTASGEPQAELWMGAHPKAPSTIGNVALIDHIEANPAAILGQAVSERFGQLPYLYKVLSAAQPLSIQSHPSAAQAREGFARENAAGIAIDAPHRTYRDANHKPELICAITPFEAKCGFRSLAATKRLFALFSGDRVGELQTLLDADGSDAEVLEAVMSWLLRLADDDRAALVAEVVAAAASAQSDEFARDLAWTATINDFFPGDVGVVVALLLNHVVLAPGEAVFLSAGNLHAYLRGMGIELMANSDNVVRGACTAKHIDIDELLTVVNFSPIDPPVQRAAAAVHTFDSPVPEFSLTRYEIRETTPVRVTSMSADILIVTEGAASIRLGQPDPSGDELDLAQGDVVFVSLSDGPYELTGAATIFRATAGDLT